MERLDKEVGKHITNLKALWKQLHEREEMRLRQDQFREWKRRNEPRKRLLAEGKLPHPKNSERHPSTGKKSSACPSSTAGALSTVLDSLSKLAELDKRISTLEVQSKHSMYCIDASPGNY
jgi:hypothetical protein